MLQEREPTYEVDHEWDRAGTLTETVVMAVARASRTDPTDIPPINDVIDADSLNRLFEPRSDGSPRAEDALVTFTLSDCYVSVDGRGRVAVYVLSEYDWGTP